MASVQSNFALTELTGNHTCEAGRSVMCVIHDYYNSSGTTIRAGPSVKAAVLHSA